jgi:CRP/FNR family transcriptional regulator, dissimilatory nitrate respiration regulator
MNIREFLANLPLFKDLPDEEVKSLSTIVLKKELKPGEIVFHDGERAEGLYIIFSGRVKIFKLSFDGKEQVLHIMGPGEPFAEVPVFQGGIFPANAQAIEKTEVVFIPREDFVGIIRKDPAIAMNMLAVLSKRLREFSVTIESLSLRGVPQRLSAYLLHLSDLKENDHFELDIKKGLLANLLGTSGESLSRILGRMSLAGLIEVKGRKIHIRNREGLEAITSGQSMVEM